nr:DUF4843 domain-containing protein [Pedobacter sp. ASV19]
MKKIFIYLCVLAVILLNACKKQGLKVYNDSESKNSIYFAKTDTTNNVIFSFGYAKANVQDSTLNLLIRTIGSPFTVDRPYNLSIADSSTLKPGVDYEILNQPLRVKAGNVTDVLKIKFHRTAALAKDSAFLYLDLKPNENFTNSYLSKPVTINNVTQLIYFTRLKIRVDDIAGPPEFWTPGNPSFKTTSYLLGVFSTKKFQLLINQYNLDVNKITQPNWIKQDGNSTRISGWASGLKAYLNQMAAAGTPVYEADGTTRMTMGKYAS